MKYKNLFFIPARSGSKGLKNKNVKKINGKTLLELAILSAKSFGLKNNYIYVSTDSKKYVKIRKNTIKFYVLELISLIIIIAFITTTNTTICSKSTI